MSFKLAQCHCGQIHLRCEGEPRKVSLCCCIDCQRRTGSAFSVAVFYNLAQVTVAGETRAYSRESASGYPVTFHFCPTCGANVFWRPERMPDRIGVALGAFGDPSFKSPDQAVWTKSRHAWLDLPAGLPHHEQNPTPIS